MKKLFFFLSLDEEPQRQKGEVCVERVRRKREGGSRVSKRTSGRGFCFWSSSCSCGEPCWHLHRRLERRSAAAHIRRGASWVQIQSSSLTGGTLMADWGEAIWFASSMQEKTQTRMITVTVVNYKKQSAALERQWGGFAAFIFYLTLYNMQMESKDNRTVSSTGQIQVGCCSSADSIIPPLKHCDSWVSAGGSLQSG